MNICIWGPLLYDEYSEVVLVILNLNNKWKINFLFKPSKPTILFFNFQSRAMCYIISLFRFFYWCEASTAMVISQLCSVKVSLVCPFVSPGSCQEVFLLYYFYIIISYSNVFCVSYLFHVDRLFCY